MKKIHLFIHKMQMILEKKQRAQFWKLLFWFIVSAFLELLGVSLIYPFIQSIINPVAFTENQLYSFIYRIFPSINEEKAIFFFICFIIAVYLVKNFFLGFVYYEKNKFIYDNQKQVACKLLHSFLGESYSKHITRNSSIILRGITSDVLDFFTLLMNLLILFSHLAVCVFLVIFLFIQDYLLTLVVLLTLVIYSLVFVKNYKKKILRYGEYSKNALGKVYQDVQETFGGMKEVKVFGLENFYEKRIEKDYKEYSTTYRKYIYGLEIPRLVLETIGIGIVLIIIFIRIKNAESVINYIPTLGVFAMALFRMFPRISEANECYNKIVFFLPTVDILYKDFTDLDNKIKEHDTISKSFILEKEILFRNVSFSYENGNEVLKNVTMRIPVGKTTAIIGASGEGKTTLVDILLGLLVPQTGEIYFDGVDIHKKNNCGLHSIVGYVPQSVYLIDDSIRNNICIGGKIESQKDEAIWKVLKIANLEDDVRKMPNGLDTVIGEQGVRLSGGQKQRLGIARAIFVAPQILVLDEATSALDYEMESEVIKAISNIHGEITMIVISHRMSTLNNCDVFYLLEKGTVAETNYDAINTEGTNNG